MTAYNLACGHVFTHTNSKCKVEIYREHNTYHIKAFKLGTRIVWECSNSFSEAKKIYLNLINNTLLK